jgi:hypothetical protein
MIGESSSFGWWILFIWLIIFFISLFPSFGLIGSYASGSFGTREINVYSEIQKSP